MTKVPELFGSMVFNDKVMRERLPKDTYKSLRSTIARGKRLDLDVANIVASAMKEWALEKGATHYTHWFQPMTGTTAEKHDSFISPCDGGVIMEFSGKELVQGEPDASSFPSGGLRATFEARGYTAWDPTSYAFIKNGTLCIPTAFCSYGGEALDKKTPLLRSMDAIDRQAMRILRLFGNNDARRVITTVGGEQEYFLIDKDVFNKRPDLIYCNRTLFGARPPKGQEMDDHYFGTLKPRVAAFMKELDEELWKLGVLAKTEHNEVAPAQHELAPIYATTNIATDHNQLTMEMMKAVAERQGLVCLLHEKPFAGVNGSGKHNNWSISTDTGMNLLEPGDTPSQNAQFLLFMMAVIKAVDEHQDLLRISVASAGNDHRLGANEAPPAIVSIFLGEELEAILADFAAGTEHEDKQSTSMSIGAKVLPRFQRDVTDRNRTSPFAFTGNKFEFRMVGSSSSLSDPNVVLNTIVAESLRQFADRLENAADFDTALHSLLKETYNAHKRILFSGNNYAEEWVEEAGKRGLLNLKTAADALPHFVSEKNVQLFTTHGVFNEPEMHSRCEILLESYCKTINIEVLTMIDMAKREIIPAVIAYEGEVSRTAWRKKSVSAELSTNLEERLLKNIARVTGSIANKLDVLEEDVIRIRDFRDTLEAACYYRDAVIPHMADLRSAVDELETIVDARLWPYPSYGEILYSVR